MGFVTEPPSAEMSTHVKVSEEVRAKLKSLKGTLGLRSVDAVIEHLLSPPPSSVEHVSEGDDAADVPAVPQKRRKKNVRPPLFSFSALADRAGMLEYYTGFDEIQLRMLIGHVNEVMQPPVFSPSPTSPCCGLSCVFFLSPRNR